MAFSQELGAIRFGCGLSPEIAPHESARAIFRGLSQPDKMATEFPVEQTDGFLARISAYRVLNKKLDKSASAKQLEAQREAVRTMRRETAKEAGGWFAQYLLRRAHSQNPMIERLTWFWADHFTAAGKNGILISGIVPYIEAAIRPNLTGKFEDLLIAAATHPLMLHYLDQDNSVGPNSPRAQRNGGKSGLNENLAREVMELHSLGVDGPYTQSDVTELAKLLAGISIDVKKGRTFRIGMAEPGAKTVLGKTYGAQEPAIDHAIAALRDLARHHSTARNVATKLAKHFVSDTPQPSLIYALTDTFTATGGDMLAVYETLLTHPSSWDHSAPNIKQPLDLIGSALRALAIPPKSIQSLAPGKLRSLILNPMAQMGHEWGRPLGPNGLPEADETWIGPQSIAARLQWAMSAPAALMRELPDPRTFVETALGPLASPQVQFAAKAAETRWEGIGLVLACPEFQKM